MTGTSIPTARPLTSGTARPPWTVETATVLTMVAAGLLLGGMVIELAAGASATTIGWPVVWAAAMVFHVTMARRGRQWGRVMLAVQAALTWLLAKQLIFTVPSLLDFAPRPEVVVGLTFAGALTQAAGAAAFFLPPSNTYTRRHHAEARLMSPRLRKAVLTTHISGSVAWMGLIILESTLATVSYTVDEPAMFRALHQAEEFVDSLLLQAVAFIALFSGLALALGTRWRLLHHWWVVTKFVLTLLVMILPVVIYKPAMNRGYALILEGRTPAEVHAALGFWGFVPALHLSSLMMLTAAVLSTYKPRGQTRFGRSAAVERQRRVSPGRISD
jgi:hypothetical protein